MFFYYLVVLIVSFPDARAGVLQFPFIIAYLLFVKLGVRVNSYYEP